MARSRGRWSFILSISYYHTRNSITEGRRLRERNAFEKTAKEFSVRLLSSIFNKYKIYLSKSSHPKHNAQFYGAKKRIVLILGST